MLKREDIEELIGAAVIAAVLLLVGLWPRPTEAAEWSHLRQVVVPVIATKDRTITHVGSMVIVEPGVAITAYHVVRTAEEREAEMFATVNGRGVKLEHAGYIVERDIAVVKGAFGCPCAKLGTNPAIDEAVLAIGYPLYLRIQTQWVSHGHVQRLTPKVIWHSAFTAPGSSGGGLFAKQGGEWRLVGIPVGVLGTERQFIGNVGNAAPADSVADLLDFVKSLTQ